MLNRVNQTLSSAIWNEDDIDYSHRSIHDLKNTFSGPTHLNTSYAPPEYAESYSPSTRGSGSRPQKKWHKPAGGYGSVPAGLQEPGWTASSAPKQTEMGWTPSRQHVRQVIPQESYLEKQSRPVPRPVNRPAPPQPQQHHQQPYHIHHEDTGTPAWAGSLRGAGGPKPWEVHAAAAALEHEAPVQQQQASPRQQQPAQNAAQGSAFQPHQPRVQNVHYGPGASTPQYSQINPSQADNTDSAKVAHLQYNSPLQLYSRDNAEDVLKGQTGGKPGTGSMVITGGGGGKSLDLSKSETYRLIHEQEHGGPRSARYVEHQPGQEMQYHGYQDQQKQSPSMQALQHFVGEAPQSPQGQQAHAHPPHAQQQPHAAQQPVAAGGGGGGGGGGEDPTGYSDF